MDPLDDFTYFALWFTESEVYVGSAEQDSFVHETAGRIVELDTGGGLIRDVGEFAVIQVDADNASASGISVFEVFDTSQVTMNYYEALYESDIDFSIDVHHTLGTLGFIPGLNLLIIDRLIVLPAFRGQNVGLNAMATLIQRFQIGASVVAIKPFPLQSEGRFRPPGDRAEFERLGLHLFSKNFRSSTAKLRRVYRKLGFKRVLGTDYMVRLGGMPLPDHGQS